MQILSIEKLGDKIFGCLDDGICYQIFSVDSDGPIILEEKYHKSSYDDYSSFVLFYCGMDPGTMFLEEPVEIGLSDPEDLSYEILLDIWNTIWPT
jgi:hypothetical protein